MIRTEFDNSEASYNAILTNKLKKNDKTYQPNSNKKNSHVARNMDSFFGT